MTGYPVHTVESAPEGSREILAEVRQGLGMIPNLAATMAEAPSLVKAFFAIRDLYRGAGTLTPLEVEVLSLTNAFENRCGYCMALHSAFAAKEGLSPESLAALRRGQAPTESRLRALSDLSRALVARRGKVTTEELDAFLAAGWSRGQALEVVLGIAVSILANYSHHLTHAPLDGAFQGHAWSAPEPVTATAGSRS